MVSRSHEGIISKIAADVSLDNFSADSISRNEVLVLAFRAHVISMAASHYVPGKTAKLGSENRGGGHKAIRGSGVSRVRSGRRPLNYSFPSRLEERYR